MLGSGTHPGCTLTGEGYGCLSRAAVPAGTVAPEGNGVPSLKPSPTLTSVRPFAGLASIRTVAARMAFSGSPVAPGSGTGL